MTFLKEINRLCTTNLKSKATFSVENRENHKPSTTYQNLNILILRYFYYASMFNVYFKVLGVAAKLLQILRAIDSSKFVVIQLPHLVLYLSFQLFNNIDKIYDKKMQVTYHF